MTDTLNYDEAAKLLKVKPATLRKWVSEKAIPHFRINNRTVRFTRSIIEDWMKNHLVKIEK